MARMAMTSEDTAMSKRERIMNPSERPLVPSMPMMMLRRDWQQKSMTQPMFTLVGSMFRRGIPDSLSNFSSL